MARMGGRAMDGRAMPERGAMEIIAVKDEIPGAMAPLRDARADAGPGVGKGAGTRILTLCDVPLSDEFQAFLRMLCEEYGADYPTMVAMAEVESGFDPNAVGAGGELGMWQVMPSTAAEAEVALGRRFDLFDPWDNAEAAVWLMAHYAEKYGDQAKALMAYNMGEAGAERAFWHGPLRSEYAACVMERAAGYGHRAYKCQAFWEADGGV